jgi:hypothetical protein
MRPVPGGKMFPGGGGALSSDEAGIGDALPELGEGAACAADDACGAGDICASVAARMNASMTFV